jgi:hypothetical protein
VKILHNERHLLFSPPEKPASPLEASTAADTTASASRQAPAASFTPQDAALPTPPDIRHHGPADNLLGLLTRAAPSLWARVQRQTLSKRDQREKLLDLVEWLSGKEHLSFRRNEPQPYLWAHTKVAGRLQAVVSAGDERVALEVAFQLDPAGLAKLHAGYLQGIRPLLLWGGSPPETRSAFSERAATLFGPTDLRWLSVSIMSRNHMPR